MYLNIKNCFYSILSLFIFSNAVHAAGIYNEEKFTLNNGLDVIVVPDHRSPVIFHAIGYYVGGLDEPKGYSGQAHLLEHLMFKGTKQKSGQEFDTYLSSVGGQQNGYTNTTSTGYYQIAPITEINTLMQWEASRMRGIIINQDILNTERKIVLQEKRQKFESSAFGKYYIAKNNDMYTDGKDRSVIGSTADLNAVNLQSLKEFYNTYYHPNNAYVILAGDITVEKAKLLAQKHYGALKASTAVPNRNLRTDPKHINYTKKIYTDARYSNHYTAQQYFLPYNNDADLKTATAIEMLLYILFDSPTSPASIDLVELNKLSYISASLNRNMEGISYQISYVSRGGQYKKYADTDMVMEWTKGAKKYLTQESFDLAKEQIRRSKIMFLDNTINIGSNLLKLIGDLGQVTPSEWEKQQSIRQNLSLQDIRNAYDNYIIKKPYFVGTLTGDK